MTEHDDTHEQDEVRRLLAGAAGPDPELPTDLSARLDDVLAGLVAERAQGEEPEQPEGEVSAPGGAVSLASRRRRRWPQLLVAAAAVSVVGVGIGNVMVGGAGSGDAQTAVTAESGAGAAEDGRSRLDSGVDGGEQEAAPPNATDREEAPQSAREPGYFAELAMGLKRSSLTVDVQRIEDFGIAAPVAGTPERWSRACVRPSTGARDEWLPVRLDGERAVLVLRAPAEGRRTADVFTCGDASSPAASTRVDAR